LFALALKLLLLLTLCGLFPALDFLLVALPRNISLLLFKVSGRVKLRLPPRRLKLIKLKLLGKMTILRPLPVNPFGGPLACHAPAYAVCHGADACRWRLVCYCDAHVFNP